MSREDQEKIIQDLGEWTEKKETNNVYSKEKKAEEEKQKGNEALLSKDF